MDFATDTKTLALRGISPQTIFFCDRPERVAGNMTTADFAPFWSEGKDSLPPTLTFWCSSTAGPMPTRIKQPTRARPTWLTRSTASASFALTNSSLSPLAPHRTP